MDSIDNAVITAVHAGTGRNGVAMFNVTNLWEGISFCGEVDEILRLWLREHNWVFDHRADKLCCTKETPM